MRVGERRILVTGGAGMIGSAVVWVLNRLNLKDIAVCDRPSDDDRYKNLIPLRFCDCVDADDLFPHLAEPENRAIQTIVHLGACADTTDTDGRFLMKNNFEFTKKLAQLAAGRKIRFVYISSVATSGDGAQGMEDGESDLKKVRPLNIYAYPNHLFDIYGRSRGMKSYAAKYFNFFRPNENHKAHVVSMMARAYRQIRETGTVQLFTSYHPQYAEGCQRRDFLYVKMRPK
jgi:ADP-L-glycero-D-manno-heptose 6-epimerase